MPYARTVVGEKYTDGEPDRDYGRRLPNGSIETACDGQGNLLEVEGARVIMDGLFFLVFVLLVI